jgi:hypothetical protein
MVNPKFKDSATLLKEKFANVTLVEQSTVHKLESAFTGVWPLFYSGAYGYTLGNSTFNSCGDLLFELVRPLDRQGRICVPTGNRRDIYLPTKTRSTCICVSSTSMSLINSAQRPTVTSQWKVRFFTVSAQTTCTA